MTYQEVLENAKKNMGDLCKSCPVCDGRACRNSIPGPGAKGVGDTAIRNYDEWKKVHINMDTINEMRPVDTSLRLFGKEFSLPIFAGPVGAVGMHYGDKYNDEEYNNILVPACKNSGIAAFTGDGVNEAVMKSACEAIKKADGIGIPTIKPWNMETIEQKIELVKNSGAFAFAMDIDAAGLPFLKNMNPPAGSKSISELAKIKQMAGIPFIIKGVMTAEGAKKAVQAGADAIIVSNHGGRVLDGTPATAEVLPYIAKAVMGEIKVFVDGGIRSGVDVFKALALGADGVIIARPFVNMVYGAEEEGVKIYVDKLRGELEDTMSMCGAYKLSDIRDKHIF